MRGQRAAFLIVMAAVLLACCRVERPASTAAWAELSGTKFVALTFDDGPRAGTTGSLLDGLRARGADATFFLVGSRIAGNEALLRRMRDEGHQIGNHSWSHRELRPVFAAILNREIGLTNESIRAVCGNGSYWVRPPYGLLRKSQQSCLSTPLIHWSVDPEDWKLLDAEKVTAAVLEKVGPGDIILLHDIYPSSVDAALRIIDALEPEGYVFVTVEELLALYGVAPQAGRFYTDAEQN